MDIYCVHMMYAYITREAPSLLLSILVQWWSQSCVMLVPVHHARINRIA